MVLQVICHLLQFSATLTANAYMLYTWARLLLVGVSPLPLSRILLLLLLVTGALASLRSRILATSLLSRLLCFL